MFTKKLTDKWGTFGFDYVWHEKNSNTTNSSTGNTATLFDLKQVLKDYLITECAKTGVYGDYWIPRDESKVEEKIAILN